MEEPLSQQQPQTPPVQPAPQFVAPAPVASVTAPVTQPVFYSLSPEEEKPRATPWFQKRQMMAIAVSGLILMAITAVVIVFAMNAMRASNAAKQAAADKAAAVQGMVANGTTQSDAARQAGFVDGCKGLTDEAYASCVSLIAFDTADTAPCEKLTDAQKLSCVDGTLLVKAKAGKSYQACSAITDDVTRSACQAAIRTDAVAAEDCGAYGVPAEYCSQQVALSAAIASGDPASCDTLAPEAQDGCRDLFTSLDADGDGLNVSAEHSYGTSDQNPDTDGDGYTDGDEIASGHDPLKK